MGSYILHLTAVCNHAVEYRYACRRCEREVGPQMAHFEQSATLPMEDAAHRLSDLEGEVLTRFAQMRLVENLARIYRNAVTLPVCVYPPEHFDNHCPYCGTFQNWFPKKGKAVLQAVSGREAKPECPDVDWRLEQMSSFMVALFNEAVKGEDRAYVLGRQMALETMRPGIAREFVTLALGEPDHEAGPSEEHPRPDIPPLAENQRAVGYTFGAQVHWIVLENNTIHSIY